MRRTPENLAFAARLKQALTRSPKRVKNPSDLALLFNLHYTGKQITNQAAQKWLIGDNKPSVDKIETLARLFDVPVLWLRYGVGDCVSPRAQKSPPALPSVQDLGEGEIALIQHYRQLSPYQQELALALVKQLSLNVEIAVPAQEEPE